MYVLTSHFEISRKLRNMLMFFAKLQLNPASPFELIGTNLMT